MLSAFAVLASSIGSFLPTLVADFFVTALGIAKFLASLVFVSIGLAFVVINGQYFGLCLSLWIVIAFRVAKPIELICPAL